MIGQKIRAVAIVAGAFAVMPALAAATSAIVHVVDQRDAAQARVDALQHARQRQPTPVVVTVSPTPGTAGSAPRSPLPAVSGSLTVVAADRPGSGSSGGSGTSSGGGAGPAPGPTTPPQAPPSSPPASQPPRQATCSTVRVAAQKPPLGVLACATVQATARIGSPVR